MCDDRLAECEQLITELRIAEDALFPGYVA
jgi:hypothetical protein